MKFICWLILFLLLVQEVSGQERKIADEFLIVFYNVENLFDTENDPAILDDEFTPDSEKMWDAERYEKKLDDIAEVLGSIRKRDLPEIIGLCEVENRKVLEDLINAKKLRREEFGIVHQDSPDARGIDVALLYRKERFKILAQKVLPVDFPFDTIRTRDILYVKGETGDPETFHVFVNHWSSRTEGDKTTERRRIYAAVSLRKSVDSILNFEPDAKIIIMGDFNDEPTNMSLHTVLNAGNKRKNATNR
ncbi:MAG: hypothetical protein JSV24_02540, partial [Bacteroidales bacterium]